MINFEKPIGERAPEDEKLDDPVKNTLSEQDLLGVNAPDQKDVPYPEVQGGALGNEDEGVPQVEGVDSVIEAQANEILEANPVAEEGKPATEEDDEKLLNSKVEKALEEAGYKAEDYQDPVKAAEMKKVVEKAMSDFKYEGSETDPEGPIQVAGDSDVSQTAEGGVA